MPAKQIEWKTISAPHELNDFVESFWMIANHSDKEHQIIVLPDGRFDIIFSLTGKNNFRAALKGLETKPEQATIPAHTVMFAVSFKLLAIEYLLDQPFDSLLNAGLALPPDFWGITKDTMQDLTTFSRQTTVTMIPMIKPSIDNRKRQLFELIYASNGSMSVKELSEKVFWSSRQINRYFNDQFGLSLKAYCNIIRFKASLPRIKKGQLFPDAVFTDQNHFIKEVRKMAGVTPKELYKNQNDRFILLSAMPVR